MPRHWSEQDTPDAIRGHSERLYALERPQGDPEEVAPLREVTFSFYGPLGLSVSPRWSHPDGALLVGVLVQLDTPGTSTTTVRVLRNGGQVASVPVPAGQTRAEWLGQGTGVTVQDFLQAAIVAAGAGAQSLTVQVRFR